MASQSAMETTLKARPCIPAFFVGVAGFLAGIVLDESLFAYFTAGVVLSSAFVGWVLHWWIADTGYEHASAVIGVAATIVFVYVLLWAT